MSERLDTAPQKRLKTLEAEAKESQRTEVGNGRELGKGSRFFFTLPLNPQRD